MNIHPASSFGAEPESGAREFEWQIEMLRGLAALAVMFAHYAPTVMRPGWPLQFLFTGVDLFFVITGYVFAPQLFRETTLSAKQFLVRRFFRIYPLYALAVLSYVALRFAQSGEARHVLDHLLFLSTTRSREISEYYNPAFWSLPVEVEFYLLLAVLAFMRISLSTRQFLVLLLGATLVRMAISWQLPAELNAPTVAVLAHVHLPGMLVEFLFGACAWLVLRRGWMSRPLAWAAVAAGAAIWLAAAFGFSTMLAHGEQTVLSHWLFRGNVGAIAALGFAVTLVGVLGVPWTHALRRPSMLLGGLSYATYLWHNATPRLIGSWGLVPSGPLLVAASVVITLLFAYLVHRTIELPLRTYGRRLSKQAG